MTPHAPSFSHHFLVSSPETLAGDLASFGDMKDRVSFPGCPSLAETITREAARDGLSAGPLDEGQRRRFRLDGDLDHGATVPLWFVAEAVREAECHSPCLVHLSISGSDLSDHYRYGRATARAIAAWGDPDAPVGLVASGDLSHRLLADGPYGYHPEGPRFDQAVQEAVRTGDPGPLLHMTDRQREQAGECGLRSILFLFGLLEAVPFRSRVLSYEGPFGVGYCVAEFLPSGGKAGEAGLPAATAPDLPEPGRRQEGPLAALARRALETRILEGRRPNREEIRSVVQEDQGAEALLAAQRGAFVCIKSDGRLRGCIGTVHPIQPDLAREIVENAISAGLRDPRFSPVEAGELVSLSYTVDVMGDPEPVRDLSELDPGTYGVIVRCGGRSGLLLPDLEGVDSVAEQLSIALSKGGIRPDEPYTIQRFRVDRHT